ncbi:hypothetical protein [Metabacillus schmidteae]|uniref:hypothetical protein n=1 Tax=Metabacillus schmidteae TaxID=2730405 RepID=UPI00158CD33A|nr:hypothetical protein [Metabacillus schmidteae]
MDALALLPVLIIGIIYLAVIGFTIWFAITLINAQKDRNNILLEISKKLDGLEVTRNEE